jgi:hypothetical protein
LQNSDQNKPQKPKATATTLQQNYASPKGEDEREERRRREEKAKPWFDLQH